MSVFAHYARYYNLLYKDKNYRGEVDYLVKLLEQYASRPRSILNLGCGTGKHDFLLADRGYDVTGVDLSADMIAVADQTRQASATRGTTQFLTGDLREVRLGRQFDAVVSLFHVMSYQVTNADLDRAFQTVKAHLKPGGTFVFDAWYGPGVLTDPPVTRVKRLEDEVIAVTRTAEPVMHPRENVVDVNYALFVRDKQQNAYQEVQEQHRMRYLFVPEVEMLLAKHGFTLRKAEEWMSGAEPGFAWNICFICANQS
ncbi:MAG: class I SAM-dependent methyltransferase [Cytophagales bacterium]|nr:class I SAM-dependent methyltransferase [Cytophagales bacterium]